MNKKMIYGIDNLLSERECLVSQIKKLTQDKDRIESIIKDEMGENQVAITPGGYEINYADYSQLRVNSRLLRDELPDIFYRFSTEIKGRRFSVKNTRVKSLMHTA